MEKNKESEWESCRTKSVALQVNEHHCGHYNFQQQEIISTWKKFQQQQTVAPTLQVIIIILSFFIFVFVPCQCSQISNNLGEQCFLTHVVPHPVEILYHAFSIVLFVLSYTHATMLLT